MKFINEFKAFILRGNVVDMAIAFVIGGAFSAIVNSLVKDIINPIIGILSAGIDFSSLKYVLQAANGDTPEVAIAYGMFINAVFNFLIIALVFFFLIKIIGKLKAKTDAEKAKAEALAAAAKVENQAKELANLKNLDDKELLAKILLALQK